MNLQNTQTLSGLFYNTFRSFWSYGFRINILLISLMLSACGGPKLFRPPPVIPDDRYHVVEKPKYRADNVIADAVDQQVTNQIQQALDFSDQARIIAGKKKEAYNVNAFGEIPNSSWFTNRNYMQKMSLEEIARGPNQGTGPDTSQTWTIFKAKAEGVTPGFNIIDSRGDRYVIKFDPTDFPEIATGAELVSTKIFYALGFNTPENYITYFDPKILHLGGEVEILDKKGRERFMVQTDLDDMLGRIDRLDNGLIRATASKFLDGVPIGPFRYEKTRKDDPNDFIRHERRRELRALRMVNAWLNHADTKSGNSLDTFFTEKNGKSYVWHCLIDFGAALGSGTKGAAATYRGFENDFDPHALFMNIVTLGLWVKPYDKLADVKYPSVGLFQAEYFEPMKYKFNRPNPAFERMTKRDGYWAAKLIMSLTDDQLWAAVEQGQYSNPEAAKYLHETMIARRNKVGRYWFDRLAPLDQFKLSKASDNKYELCFIDLAVESGLEDASNTTYFYQTLLDGKKSGNKTETGNCVKIDLSEIVEGKKAGQLAFQFSLKKNNEMSKTVTAHLQFDISKNLVELIGIERED